MNLAKRSTGCGAAVDDPSGRSCPESDGGRLHASPRQQSAQPAGAGQGMGSISLACDRLSRLLPAVLSLALHMGLGLVLVFVGTFAAKAATGPTKLDGPITAGPVDRSGITMSVKAPTPPGRGGQPSAIPAGAKGGADKGPKRFNIPGIGNAPGIPGLISDASGDHGVNFGPGGGVGKGPGGSLPVGPAARYVIYVIDRSGSMAETFETVKDDMAMSIGSLEPNQFFHVILLGEGKTTIENPPGKFQAATRENKDAFVKFIQPVSAKGATHPITALTRAFDLMDAAGDGGKLICLLTDGAFPDNEAVLTLVRARNAAKKVQVDTFLFGWRSNEVQNVLERIANFSKGSYKYTNAGD